jgi:antitoxin VapB
MQTARLFVNGRSQAVRLPKEFNFRGDSVYVQKVGEAVILVPFDKDWEVFMHGLNSFSDDYMSEGRLQGKDQKREKL